MIVSGILGKLILKLLTRSSTFNRNFAVVKFGDVFKIFKYKTKVELRKIDITRANILSLKFDYYQSPLCEHIAQISKHDFNNKILYVDVWDSEQMANLIKRFELRLTEKTNHELKKLLDRKVFKEKYGMCYNHFISVWLHPDIIKAANSNRKFAKGTLKYSINSKAANKEHRLKAKFDLSKQEAVNLYSEIAYWKND